MCAAKQGTKYEQIFTMVTFDQPLFAKAREMVASAAPNQPVGKAQETVRSVTDGVSATADPLSSIRVGLGVSISSSLFWAVLVALWQEAGLRNCGLYCFSICKK